MAKIHLPKPLKSVFRFTSVFIGIVSLLVGLGVFFRWDRLLEYSKRVNPRDTVSTPIDSEPAIITKYPPTAVRMKSLGNKTWPVQAALVRDNQWDMFDTSVAWLSTSAVPGEGNVILYAHDRKSLWADLYKLKSGDIVEVLQNGMWVLYVVFESKAVSPKDVDAILSDANQLTMYTCEGTFDQKRRVVYARPI